MKRYFYLCLVLAVLNACTKDKVSRSGKNPYQETVLPAIYLTKNGINPASGKVGDEVTISGKGFDKNKDKMAVLFNGVKATVVALTDTTVRVKIPLQAATGNVSVQVDQQYFFGPFFRVFGVFEMDTLYPSLTGANGTIGNIIAVRDGKYLITGDFTSYGGTSRNRVARLNHDGTLDGSFASGSKNGTNSYVSTAVLLKDGKYLVAGAFNSYEGVSYVNSIAMLNSNGSMAADKAQTPSNNLVTVSALQGGVSGQVGDLNVQPDDKILLSGYFRFFVRPNFKLTGSAGQDSVHLDSIQMNGLLRLNKDGSLDSSFNYDLVNHMGKEGPNGFIARSMLMPDGKLLIVGSFTKYNGQTANHIARLNPDGSLDPTFTAGSGADLTISNIAQQPDGKFIIVGSFNNYGGTKMAHVARIDANGVIDPTFNVGAGADGYIYNVAIMPGGQVILSGAFTQFGNLQRNNFIVLNADGTIHPTYNSFGGINPVYNGSSSNFNVGQIVQQPGENAMLVVGAFTRFDFRTANRIVRIKWQ
ncbi:IPT/TIG domain-containing protein [Chitinophaga sp. 212800010-3]|uniref:IPT/TIG domain-containing protein n=1 Tax=unclassified Chitinophaga TaxID=2619133 RepID=UPI002DE5F85F|nr:Delta-60 repeat domain-containing protein [Chitinophaga sp. 212800010-3]